MTGLNISLPTTLGADPEDDEDLLGEDGEQDEERVDDDDINEGHVDDDEETPAERRARERDERIERQLAAQSQTIDRLIQGREGDNIPAIDFSDLPDPVDKPDEFKTELGKRVNDAMAQSGQATAQADQNAKINQLWADFKGEYPDLAPKELLANSAAAAEIQSLSAQGLDSLQWAVNNPKEFREKVATRMRSELGTKAPAGDDNPDPKPAKAKSANRTGGVGGGTKGAAGGGSKKSEKPAGFLDQLKKSQQEAGLI